MEAAAMDELTKYREGNKRERATITSARVEYSEDHCCWKLLVYTEGVEGGSQGFPPLFESEDDARDMAADIAQTFGVETLSEIVGKECWVLRPFGYLNDQIEGFEVDGRRFTRTDWCRKTNPRTPSRLEREARAVKADIRRHRGQLMEARKRLRTLEDEYTEWAAR